MEAVLLSRSSLVRPAAVLLVIVLLVTSLAACGSNPSSTATPGAVETPVGLSPSITGEQTLTLTGGMSDPPTLDPALASDAESAFVIRQLFSGLVTFDDNMNLVPDIAERMPDLSADARTYTFHLRQGVQFSNGDEVTADDFKYSLERAADPALAAPNPGTQLPAGTYLNDIVGVEQKLKGEAKEISGVVVKDKYTLEITIDQPKSYFLSKLANVTAYVVNKNNAKIGSIDWTAKPVGTGPFKLAEWQHDELLKLERNDKYYLGAPKLQTVNILMGAGAAQPMNQYETGVLDVTDVPLYDVDRVSDKTNPLWSQLVVVPELSTTYVGLNTRQKPFDDPKIRQAIAHALDKTKITTVMFADKVKQASGMVPPDMPGFSTGEDAQNYDLTLARQLIAESSYKEAKNVPRITIYTADESLAKLLYEVFRQELGLEVEIRAVDWADYLNGLDRSEYQAYVLSWSADYPDPQNFLDVLFGSTSPSNFSRYVNPEVDLLLQTAAVEKDTARREAQYRDIEHTILQDAPVIPLYHNVRYVLIKKQVQGLKVTPMGILSLRKVWISK
jgi:oligopeptide transport system substrate-binding protein